MLFDISLRKLFAHMVYVAMSIVYNVSAISYTVGVILFGTLVLVEYILSAVLQLLLIILLIIRQIDGGSYHVRIEYNHGHALGGDIAEQTYAMTRPTDVLIRMKDEPKVRLAARRYHGYILRIDL